MAGKRQYKVKGTKDFIVLAGVFFFLGIWAVIDGWFPPAGVLKNHPQAVDVICSESGPMKLLNVAVGDTVVPAKEGSSATLIAELKTTELDAKLEEAKVEYSELRDLVKNGDADAYVKAEQVASQMKELLEQMNKKKVFTPALGNDKDGVITELFVDKYSYVEAGQRIAVITPNTHFYVFNKSLAILSFFAFWAFLLVHIFWH